jgi:hypothetical protein
MGPRMLQKLLNAIRGLFGRKSPSQGDNVSNLGSNPRNLGDNPPSKRQP